MDKTKMTIKELRESTGMTQAGFADAYGIPLSTLRKWEQGEATPAPYIVRLIARTLPVQQESAMRITDRDGRSYYYDQTRQTLCDERGTWIDIGENLDDVKPQNLALYVRDLYDEYYAARDKFCKDCEYDRKEDILWT